MPSSDFGPESPKKTSLNGWKEIAAYLGKGVRTVQRWERELGLPVRRLTGAHAEIIYALPEELDAWRLARETAPDSCADSGKDSDHGPTDDTWNAGGVSQSAPNPRDDGVVSRTGDGEARSVPDDGLRTSHTSGWRAIITPRRRARWAAAMVSVALGACVWLGLAWRHGGRSEQPFGWKVQNHALRVYSSAGTLLWEHRFESPLTDDRYPDTIRGGQPRTISARSQQLPVVIEDIDGDGSREVLFAPVPEANAPALFCFNSDGTVRFVHRPNYRVRFGEITYDGPWAPLAIQVTGNGRSAIWLSMHHQEEFPAVVDKLDPSGRLLGQYWNNGELNILRPAVLDGRRVVLAGGSNNEFVGATLVALDEENPTGVAPSLNPKFTCQTCPAGVPVLFLVIPPTDVQRSLGTTSAVDQIRLGETGLVTLVVISDITVVTGPDGPAQGQVYYRLNPQLQVVGSEIEASFRLIHDELFRRGILDHPCDARDQRGLWPVLRWKGPAFERIHEPEAK